MNLKDKLHDRVFIPVSVEKELPKVNGRYFVVCDKEFEDGNIFMNGSFLGDVEIGVTTSWLKPTEQSYVLSPEELMEIIGNAFEAGKQYGFYEALNANAGDIPDEETYINNLTL